MQGAFCGTTDEACDAVTSTCGGRTELCHGRGPAWPDDTASTLIIAQRQAAAVRAQAEDTGAHLPLHGRVDFRHTYVDMRNVEVAASAYTRAGRTCPPAMGDSFAAGTTDGPGALDFTQVRAPATTSRCGGARQETTCGPQVAQRLSQSQPTGSGLRFLLW